MVDYEAGAAVGCVVALLLLVACIDVCRGWRDSVARPKTPQTASV